MRVGLGFDELGGDADLIARTRRGLPGGVGSRGTGGVGAGA